MTKLLLVVLISFQTLNACSGMKLNQYNRTTETMQTMQDSCNRCDIEIVKQTVSNLQKLKYSDIYQFLYTFSKDCSKNVEYSEYSNEVLFKVLENYPKQFIACMNKEKELESEYIYSELSTPLLDIDGKAIHEKVKSVSGDNHAKERILKALRKAVNY